MSTSSLNAAICAKTFPAPSDSSPVPPNASRTKSRTSCQAWVIRRSNPRHTGGEPNRLLMMATHKMPIVIAATRSVIVVNTCCGVSILATVMIATVYPDKDRSIGPKAAEVAPGKDANAYPENESRQQTDSLAGKKTGADDRHRSADERCRNPIHGIRERRSASRLG